MTRICVRARVGAETYALPVEHVLEVAEAGELASVPGAAAALLGVRNLRGRVLPVFDLARVFGVDRGDGRRVIVVEEGERQAGLAVDDVSDVGPLPDGNEEAESSLLAGQLMVDGQLVGIADVRRLLDGLAGGNSE